MEIQQRTEEQEMWELENPPKRKEERPKTREEDKGNKSPMGDVYDVYGKASGVHSRISGMTEDYTLTRYDVDIYNLKFPKFVREQRKILRIIKSFLLIPYPTLQKFYNTEKKAKEVWYGLKREYKTVEQLIIGELDECAIMGRTPKGEVIEAFLKHGLNKENQENFDVEVEQPSVRNKMTEKTLQ